MTMTNANKRQRPDEATAATATATTTTTTTTTTTKRHLEDPATDEDLTGVREAFKHLTEDDYQQLEVVEISDDGDDPAADGDADTDTDADDSRISPADDGVAYGSYCGDGYSDAVQQCSDERRCEAPEDCSALAAVVGYPLGCYADIACANVNDAEVAGEVQQEEDAKEPMASPIAPPTASSVIPAKPTAAPVIVENGTALEPTAAPIVPSTAAPAPVVKDDEDEVQDEDEDSAVMSDPTAETPANDATGTVSSPEATATLTQSPTDPAPVLVARETDEAGNTILYSCAEAAPILTDPATGATAPSYQSMVVEFDYELYWNEGSTNNADANPQDEEDGSDGTGTRKLTNAVLQAAVDRIAGSYLAELAEQYNLAGDDCSAIKSAFVAADNNGNSSRKAMLRRTLMRRLLAETTVVEISDGGDVIDDVDCATDPPSDHPSASCVPIKAKVGVKYTGTDEASIRSTVFSTAKNQVESIPADVSGKFLGIAFVGQRVDESAGKDNLNPFPGNLSPGVAAAELQQTNGTSEGYADFGIAFMSALALAVLLVALLVGRGIRNRARRNKASHEMVDKSAKSRDFGGEEGSFAGVTSIGSDNRIGIDRRSMDESGHFMVGSPATSAPNDQSGEYDEVEVELNPDDLAEPAKMEKKRSRGLGMFRSRSRSKSPGRQRSRSKSPGAGENAPSILYDLNQEENMAAAAPVPINRTSTNQSIEACLDYYDYNETMLDSRGRSVTPTRSLIDDDDENIYGIVDFGE